MPGSLDGAIDLTPEEFRITHDPGNVLSTDPSTLVGQPLDQFAEMLTLLPQMAIKVIADLLTDPGALVDLILQFPEMGLDVIGDFFANIPLIGPIVQAITGVVGSLLDLDGFFGNIEAFLGLIDFTAPDFNPITAIADFITSMLGPSGLLAQLFGGFLSGGVIPGLDASKIISGIFPQAMIDGLGDLFAVVGNFISGITGGLNFQAFIDGTYDPIAVINNFIGNILAHIGFLPISFLNNTDSPNLLVAPGFDTADSISLGMGWTWDAAEGRTTPGSAKVTGGSLPRELISNPVSVAEGQQLSLSAYLKWAGIVYTGTTPISMGVVRYLGNDPIPVGSTVLVAPVSPATNQVAWLQMTSPYTVPAGCDKIRLQFKVTAATSAGTMWIDDADVHKVGDTIPQNWINGLLDNLGGLGDFIQNVVDAILTGIRGFPIFGAGLADLIEHVLGWHHTTLAAEASTVSATVLQSQRTIAKPQYLGGDASADMVIPLATISGPTQMLISITAAGSMLGFITAQDNGKKQSIFWLGQDTASITGFYVNLYEMDVATGELSLIEASANIISSVSNTLDWNYHNLTTPIDTLLGHVYAVELVIVGAGTYKMAGIDNNWIPGNTISHPENLGGHRNTGLPTAPSTFTPSYFDTVPAFGLGGFLFAGPTSIGYTVAASNTYTVPDWLKYGDQIDVAALGAGGGGADAGFFWGGGGGAGVWSTRTLVYGVDFPMGTPSLTVVVGAGGSGGAFAGNSGGESSVAAGSTVLVTAGGGYGGAESNPGDVPGHSPGDITLSGITYTGGATQPSGSAAGNAPGGGGAGATITFGGGGVGAPGAVFLAAYQAGTSP